MSMSGEFLTMDSNKLADAISESDDKDKTLEEFVIQTEENPNTKRLDILDTWHIMQSLWSNLDIGEIMGEELTEGIGSMLVLGTTSSNVVSNLAKTLQQLVDDLPKLEQAIEALDFDELYHGEIYVDNPSAIKTIFHDIAEFFIQAANQKAGILFRVM